MASTGGLVPITRAFLAKFYDKYPFPPLHEDVASTCTSLKDYYTRMEADLIQKSGDNHVISSLEFSPPHKIDENLWRNREQIEEILDLLNQNNWSNSEDNQTVRVLPDLLNKLASELSTLLKAIEDFQFKSSERVFNMVLTYMPQDFRGSLIRQQHDRSEKKRQAEVDALMVGGGSICDKYALLWRQQMDRRRQLAQLGSASGVYKTFVKYLVGVPQVLLDFVRQINDHHGPMEEQRQRYGPPLYQLTILALSIQIFLLLWRRTFNHCIFPAGELLPLLEKSVSIYVSEFNRFLELIGEVFENSPFLIPAEEAGAAEATQQIDEFKETIIAAGKTYEVDLPVEYEGSLVTWDFRLTSGKDVGFSVEYTDASGAIKAMLPFKRYESSQGSFCSPGSGCYKLIWDNTYSKFNRKFLRYKVDIFPPDIVERTSELSLNEDSEVLGGT